MKDYSNYQVTNTYYGGSEKKIGILIDNEEYMVKFQKQDNFGAKLYNHISEYIGSHIYDLLGFNIQETYLGTYKNEEVVLCKNFIYPSYQYVPFSALNEEYLDKNTSLYSYSYEDIMKMLRDNSKLTNVEETIQIFWKMFIVDAFIGNFDRHASNWGFLKKHNLYSLAPIFDNGSCLFPKLSDEEEMLYIMNSKEETDKRIYEFPTSQIKLNGKKSSYYEVIHSLAFKECNEALIDIVKLYDEKKINMLIDSISFISEVHKSFYKYMLKQRFNKILLESYLLLRGEK